MKHTKEPWEIRKMTNGLFGAKGQNNDWFVFENALEKDAKRIVACVNACEGIDDPELWVKDSKVIRMKLIALEEINRENAIRGQSYMEECHNEIIKLKAEIEQLKAEKP